MVKYILAAGALGAFVGGALAQSTAGQWGQCGGVSWTGPTNCPSGWYCSAVSPPYYYQCLQGAGSSTSTTSTTSVHSTTSTTSTKPTSTSSTKVSSSSTKTSSTSSSSSHYVLTTTTTSVGSTTTTACASNPSNTLITGNSFIRGVEGIYTHHYLQSQVLNTASTAVLNDYTTAAQFQVINGQLVQWPQCNPLYAVVAQPQTGDVKLGMSWSANPADTFGTFVFSGDTLEWSVPSISRPQTNAWLICPDAAGNQDVYINLGNYDYMTPTGCTDQTIHAYTGATAVP